MAQAIVNTVREPLLVLDSDLRVVVASRSYCQTFQTTPEDTQGRLLYELGAGEWNIAALRSCLERIVPEHGVKDGFEVEQSFPRIGQRTMLLNARKVFYEGNSNTTLLLAIEDITERRASERALARLLEQKDMLLREMSHRVANSLQIIASILLLKARTVRSEETRQHLQDAHRRVMSAAALQEYLQASNPGEEIEIGSYLSKLCETLAASMVGEDRPISVTVMAEGGRATSEPGGEPRVDRHRIGDQRLETRLCRPSVRRSTWSSPMRSMGQTGSFQFRTTARVCPTRPGTPRSRGSAQH